LCSRAPDAVAEPAWVIKLACVAVTERLDDNRLGVLGAALYPAGNFGDAAGTLEEAVKRHGQGGSFADGLFLSMTYQCLGQSEKARRQWDETDKRLKGFSPSSWQVKTDLDLLRRETEAVVGGKANGRP
jgi:hypothetical protein